MPSINTIRGELIVTELTGISISEVNASVKVTGSINTSTCGNISWFREFPSIG